MGVVQYRLAPLLAGYRFAAVAVADNGQEPREPVEVGVVPIDDGVIAEPYQTWLVRPRQPITSYATRAHGITDAHVRDAPPLSDVAGDICAALGGRVVVAHRGRACADLLAAPPVACPPGRVLDVRTLSARVWPASSRSLGELIRICGLRVSGSLGRAGHDALATAELFVALVRHIGGVCARNGEPVSMGRVMEWATPPVGGPAW